MSEQQTDAIDPDRFSVDELREAALEEHEGGIARPLALMLLGRKDYPEKVQDLWSLLANREQPPRLRYTSARLLGELGTADAVSALERGLTVSDGLALRGVVEG